MLEPLHPPQLWRTWTKAQGRDGPVDNERAYFDSVQVMYDACALGLGLAIAMRPLVDPFLAAHRLVEPFDGSFVLPGAYYFAAAPTLRRDRSVRVLDLTRRRSRQRIGALSKGGPARGVRAGHSYSAITTNDTMPS